MAIYERTTWVEAPLGEVWNFHLRLEGLARLTPRFVDLRIENWNGEEAESDHPDLRVGTAVRLSVRPFGIGPRLAWTSRIVDRQWEEETAVLRDRMVDGPMDRWVHTHRFYAEEGGTRIIDRLDYQLPAPLGRLSGLLQPAFEGLFAFRHRRTRDLFGASRA